MFLVVNKKENLYLETFVKSSAEIIFTTAIFFWFEKKRSKIHRLVYRCFINTDIYLLDNQNSLIITSWATDINDDDPREFYEKTIVANWYI